MSKPKGKRSVPPELTRQNETDAWSLRLKGWTQQRIAEHLGVAQSTVSAMLGRLEKRALAELTERVEAEKARQTLLLERIVDEALQAWERSKNKAVTVKTTKQATEIIGIGGPASLESVPAEETKREKTVKGRDGTSGFLAEARQALADIRKIWGLDKVSDAPSASAVAPEIAEAAIAAALAAQAARIAQGEH